MSTIIGIDLGTTYSATAALHDGVPQIVPHGDERIMPSVVGLTPQDALLIGTPARNQYVLYSALILRELKQSAEQQLREPVERAVITVPAYFSDAARQATREAGELAGFTVERIINEPTAAALAYGLDRGDEQHLVAVYDLGGGTFDVSVVELDAGVVEVRASHGNTQLGGDDFDERLVEHLVERFVAEHGIDPRDDRRALARLTRAAEQAKIALSSQPLAQVREEYLLSSGSRPLHLDIEIAREEFEELIEDLIEGTLQSFDAALGDAGITAEQLDNILLVGGSTRIPLVQRMLYEHAGIEPVMAINPDEAVALGAAVQAAIIAGEPIEAILVDVTPHSLGIAVAELEFGQIIPDRYSVIIPRNTTIPTSRSEIYSALHPDQRAIEVKIYQGEQPIASQNTSLGEFLFEDLRPEAPGQPPRVTVQFDFDVDGILHVSAVDRGSGKQARTSVRAAHTRLTPAEITAIRGDLEALELAGWDSEEWEDIGDQEQPGGASPEMSMETIGLLTRAHRALETNPANAALRETIERLRQAVQRDDRDAIAADSEALLDILYELEE